MGFEWGTVAFPAALAIVTLGLFATRMLRADGVAVLALAVAVIGGLVPADRALTGFANPVVVTVAALAVLATAVHRSGIIDVPRSALARRLRLTTPVLLGSGLLVALLAAISGRVNTRTALLRAARLPPQLADATAAARLPTQLLNAACLLGGTLTLVGGVPNLLVSAVRTDYLGKPFAVLAFLPAGLLLLLAGLVAVTAATLLNRQAAGLRRADPVDRLRRAKSFATEIVLPAGSPLVGKPVTAFEAAGENAAHVLALIREGYRRIEARPDWILEAGDVVVLDCEPAVLHRMVERYGLQPADGPLVRLANLSGVAMVEAVVTQSSDLVGRTPPSSKLIGDGGAHLFAIGRNDDHPPSRLRRTRLRAGDILVLATEADTMQQILAGLGCLPLAERRIRLGRRQLAALPLAVLLMALAAAAVGALPLWVALLAGVLVLVLTRVLTLQEAYETVPWPGLVMLAALLPLQAALHRSGFSAAAASTLAPFAAAAAPAIVAAVAIAVTMAATWLAGAAVAVLLLAPFALTLATAAGVPVDLLLMAVALGASIDMLEGRGLIAMLVPPPGRRLRTQWQADLIVVGLLFVAGTAALTEIWGP